MASQVQIPFEGVILQEHSAPISCPTPNFAKGSFEYNGASAAAEVFFLRDGVFSLWVEGDFSEYESPGDGKRRSEGKEPVV